MSTKHSCAITVYIDQGHATGLIQTASKKPPCKLFYCDQDLVGDAVRDLCHFLEDHRATHVSRMVIDIALRLPRQQAAELVRHCYKLYRQIARQGKRKKGSSS